MYSQAELGGYIIFSSVGKRTPIGRVHHSYSTEALVEYQTLTVRESAVHRISIWLPHDFCQQKPSSIFRGMFCLYAFFTKGYPDFKGVYWWIPDESSGLNPGQSRPA